MGCRFSCRSSSSSTFSNIRVVHLNGYVEEFDPPVTVSQVSGKPPVHFVCTAAQLLLVGSKPLKPETQLEQGLVYFLIPFSIFHSEASPMEMASTVSKLTAIAKTMPSKAKSPGPRTASSPARSRSPNHFLGQDVRAVVMEPKEASMKARSWKPHLAPIRERSFNGRSESDLQKEHSEMD